MGTVLAGISGLAVTLVVALIVVVWSACILSGRISEAERKRDDGH